MTSDEKGIKKMANVRFGVLSYLLAAITLPVCMSACTIDAVDAEDVEQLELESDEASELELGTTQEALFGNCYTNNEERGQGDLKVHSTEKNAITVSWYSPYGIYGGDVKIYYKKSWAFVGKRDGTPVVVSSNGMHGGFVRIAGLDKNTCYKFAAYQDVDGFSGDVLLGIIKGKTNK